MKVFLSMSLRALRAERRHAFRRSRSGRSNLMLIGKTPFRKFQRLIGDCFVALLALLAMTLGLVACLPLGLAAPTETPPPAETPSPSETIVWFPPSATA